MKKDIWAIKFRLWCKNNGYTAQDIANTLHLQRNTIYGYWAGTFAVPDDNKKKLEIELGLPIYEIFYNPELR